LVSPKCLAQQQKQARRPPALAAKHTEPHSAAGAVAAADHTRSGAEQRARTTGAASRTSAQNGTSGAVADGKHARRWATLPPPRTGVGGQVENRLDPTYQTFVCSRRIPRMSGRSTTFARVGRRKFLILDHGEGRKGALPDCESEVATASPRASASNPIKEGTSDRSMGVDATQTPSRQWLSTTLR
jgi:hypothetical protein